MVTEKGKTVPKTTSLFNCETCHYASCNKSKYERHLLTNKHKNNIIVTECNDEGPGKSNIFSCKNCNKIYKSRVGLWRHCKLCSPDIDKNNIAEKKEKSIQINSDLILEILRENQEFKALLIEQQKENTTIMNKMVDLSQQQINNPTMVNSNNTTNNNHQKFNLNFFLNETCKDAMNIQEFLENLVVTFEDLLTIGNAGFVNGVSDILVKQLRDLDVSKRPIHCTDAKRETIYLKENNDWNKDDKENTKLKNVIQKVEYKNVVSLREWCNENPDAKVNNTSNNILKDKIYLQTLQGDDRTRNKIIKNLTKEVIVEKGSDPEGDDDD